MRKAQLLKKQKSNLPPTCVLRNGKLDYEKRLLQHNPFSLMPSQLLVFPVVALTSLDLSFFTKRYLSRVDRLVLEICSSTKVQQCTLRALYTRRESLSLWAVVPDVGGYLKPSAGSLLTPSSPCHHDGPLLWAASVLPTPAAPRRPTDPTSPVVLHYY